MNSSSAIRSKISLRRHRVWLVCEHNWRYYSEHWFISMLSLVLGPIFVFVGLGWGVGALVGDVQGLVYAEFVLSALLMTSCLVVATDEVQSGPMALGLKDLRRSPLMLTPLRPSDIIRGLFVWSALKSVFVASTLLLFASLMGLVHTPLVILVLPVLFLQSWLFAALCYWLAHGFQSSVTWFIFAMVLPILIFSESIFPTSQLWPESKYLLWISPFYHCIMSVRSLLTENLQAFSVHLLVLFSLYFAVKYLLVRRFEQQLS